LYSIIIITSISAILVIYHTSTVQEVDKMITYQKDAKIQFKKIRQEIRQIDKLYGEVRDKVEKLHSLTYPNQENMLFARGGNEARDSESITDLPVEIFILNRLIHDMDIANKPLEKLKVYLQKRQKLLDNTPVGYPVQGSILNPYGFIRDASTLKAKFNQGVDFVASPGSAVKATAPGIIQHIARNIDGTWIVEIQHHFGYRSRYSGLDRVIVNEDEKIARGEALGYLSNMQREPVLHYEIIIGVQAQNPAPYLGLLERE
ncbi:MAG: M23 family metallopeptidase, partial [Candidatus Hydrogenedentota bacterium]